MELLAVLDPDARDVYDNPQRPIQRVGRVFDQPDLYLIKRYRMPRHMLLELTLQVRDSMARSSRGRNISPDVQVACALRVLAEGNFQRPSGDTVDVSQPSVSRVLQRFCEAVLAAYPNVIHFPGTEQEIADTERQFRDKFGLPNVLGCVDGTHVNIKAPVVNEHLYVNRHQRHSINVQGVCDSNMLITNVVAKFPGASHDAFVFEQSALGRMLASSHGRLGYLLGDSGYPLRSWLIVPFDERHRERMTPDKQAFNKKHTQCRSVVERCFGILKARYRCLDQSGGVLQYAPVKACQMVVTCCILHNLCLLANLPEPDERPQPEGEPEPPQPEVDPNAGDADRAALLRQGSALRDRLVALVNGR
ncbi:putative nuclease HARBI1 [Amphibalanus amphitrite]|uniref:Putative nuclease HARBI1 n=1 Tax=Amphibalanus amphitrite TaxID=1232801 RepID=A0A6A4V8Z9_AMPAM|nr:putative nuclease HARBI1 [Amphibalanus amphitrite]KAF0287118.1 putative nuclease HARBI1 [Amphibalanus amphitrite]